MTPLAYPHPSEVNILAETRHIEAKLGCKHHVVVDQLGLPLATCISGAQVQDSRLLVPLDKAILAIGDCQAELVNDQGSCMPIAPTLLKHIELSCVDTGSQQGLGATAWSHASGLADGDGLWRERLVGSTGFADFAYALSAEPTFTRHSFR